MWHYQQQTAPHIDAKGDITAERNLWASRLVQIVKDALTPDDQLRVERRSGRISADEFERAWAMREIMSIGPTFAYAAAVADVDAYAIRDAVQSGRVNYYDLLPQWSVHQVGKTKPGGRKKKAIAASAAAR